MIVTSLVMAEPEGAQRIDGQQDQNPAQHKLRNPEDPVIDR